MLIQSIVSNDLYDVAYIFELSLHSGLGCWSGGAGIFGSSLYSDLWSGSSVSRLFPKSRMEQNSGFKTMKDRSEIWETSLEDQKFKQSIHFLDGCSRPNLSCSLSVGGYAQNENSTISDDYSKIRKYIQSGNVLTDPSINTLLEILVTNGKN